MKRSSGYAVVLVILVAGIALSLLLPSVSGDWLQHLEIYFGRFPLISILLPLAVIAIVLVLSAVRVNRHPPQTCPRCGGPIDRIHRTPTDRLICVVLPHYRRYGCQDPYCGWSCLQRRQSSQ